MKAFLWVNETRDPGLTVTTRVRAELTRIGVSIAPDINADFIVVIGGDGTILQCAREAAPLKIPIVGVNMGRIGFIAELEPDELALLQSVADGTYDIDERMMLDVSVIEGERRVHRDIALNDAVISGDATAQVVDLAFYADGELLTAFTGDGVVISTPTGSTGYAMSAGGPIIEPQSRNIAVTPICPHGFKAKAFLLSETRTVKVEPRSGKGLYLTVDGRQAISLGERQFVEVRKSEHICRLIRVKNRNFYQVISEKLGKL
ncbi:NAD kinase [Clostridia bacterium]|nr:NAD kinase [Clostridia bacterium]GHV32790.1 NAD kinase [Clostridia bacterium]